MRVEIQLPAKPGHISNLEFVRILTPYVFSLRVVKGNRVLDVGSGFGHGAGLLLSAGAKGVAAVDLDQVRARQVCRLCGNSASFRAFVMDAQRLAFKDRSFDLVICFEVIEHVPQPDVLLCELRRVLKADGTLLLTTPNRAVRLLPLQRPWNREHLREYRLGAFRRRLRKHFPAFQVLGIFGCPELHDFYIRLWRPRPLQAYFGWAPPLFRWFLGPSVMTHIRARRHSLRQTCSGPDLTEMTVPAPHPEDWPFYLRHANKGCLNFFAVCALDDRVVQRRVNESMLPDR